MRRIRNVSAPIVPVFLSQCLCVCICITYIFVVVVVASWWCCFSADVADSQTRDRKTGTETEAAD